MFASIKDILKLLLFILIVGTATYFYVVNQETVFRITEAQIQDRLNSKFPITKKYVFVIELTLANPRVRLENGTSRVAAGLDAVLNIKLNRNAKPLGGTVDISAGISYAADKGAFFLVDPVVDHLRIQGIPEKFQAKVNEAAAIALSEYFRQTPIYTLRESDLKQAAAREVLKSVSIENRELVLTVGI